ncbi:MAG: YolD-like family protein [Lachnospiraceae bacterium]|nr:YolD-like family protein [Lachnospiraceae bacterium]
MTDRPKMSREERAKQFMPFAALKGYQEALRKKEKIVMPKMELSEDYKETLDRRLRQVRKNDIITVVYFSRNEYLKKTGMVSRIDETARILCIVNTKIIFDDIYEISSENISD